MKVLMVNNRLKVYGGEGTYMTSLGDELIRQGHNVQFFGLEDPDCLHGNEYGIYARKSNNPLKLLRNNNNRKQFAKLLDSFKPDIIHLNLVYFTLTPSILVEAKKRGIKIIQTIHDGKFVCPAYQLYVNNENRPCTLCTDGDYKHCIKHRCHKNSKLLSFIAYLEASYNRRKRYYDLIDLFVFPSIFMRELHVSAGLSREKTEVLCNFSRISKRTELADKANPYVLYFGRVSRIKGVELIAEAAKKRPNILFKIVGTGELESIFSSCKNVEMLGFRKGKELESIISSAAFSLMPSVCLENCPMSVLESMALGTPVVGARIGGIPELITENNNGVLFDPGSEKDFIEKIDLLYNDAVLRNELSMNCLNVAIMSCNDYASKILTLYKRVKSL